uniref:Uncharacterized protein n=1 Tax=Cajanus cajan TaxID=3821 RepID=A0A151U402_CAJCA|nr:hypothetical protein KK1_006633 [Cajanus cajan]
MDQLIRKFIWIGDSNSSKVIIVAWKTMCRPIKEEGLGFVTAQFSLGQRPN